MSRPADRLRPLTMDDQIIDPSHDDRLPVHGGRVPPDHPARLTSLAGSGYGDVFTLDCPGADRWTSDAWARAIFGDVPDLLARFIWQGLLHLHLNRRASPDLVAGWPVIERSDHLTRLETRSWFLTGQLVVTTDDRSASLGTFVRYDRRGAGAVWLPLSAVHRSLMPGLLRDAHQKLSRRTEAAT